jgi:hypothetical protein
VENLRETVLKIIPLHPNGVNHAQLVRLVLESGYQEPNLSANLMEVVKELHEKGTIRKNKKTRTIKPVVQVEQELAFH